GGNNSGQTPPGGPSTPGVAAADRTNSPSETASNNVPRHSQPGADGISGIPNSPAPAQAHGPGYSGGSVASGGHRTADATMTEPTNAVANNSSDGHSARGVQAKDDDMLMSPFDRTIARHLRHIIFFTYSLIWLLFLLFIAYRLWRWLQERQDRRNGGKRQ
ncbi:MAG TPA: hypothetical protein VF988_02495, partial [Verrucomicrobiae bacterium]